MISIQPFLARALRCSSAALALLKPKRVAISARVGGIPVSAILRLISSKISAWRGVKVSWLFLFFYTVTVSIYSIVCSASINHF
ncbi:hypothetical protein SPWS13_2624 [Shewanella putrefaciens]|nr:hypothetical protein SPWS13_2624 [Shewanella putrefaciens]